MQICKISFVCLLVVFIFVGTLSAQEDNFIVSKDLDFRNSSPAISLDGKGNAVVVWENWDENTLDGDIYSAFLKYKKSSGTFKVKKPVKINRLKTANSGPTIVYDEENKTFLSAWLRQIPDNVIGRQLVVMKLNARGKPVGKEIVLYSENKEFVNEAVLVRFKPGKSAAGTDSSYFYALTFRVYDKKDDNKRSSKIYLAFLDRNARKLLGKTLLLTSDHLDSSMFDGSLSINSVAAMADGSFFIPYVKYKDGINIANILKVSSGLKVTMNHELGETKDNRVWACSLSDNYAVATWQNISSKNEALMYNQVFKLSGDRYKKTYNPSNYGLYTALAPLKNGGAAQLLHYDGVILNSQGKVGKTFSTQNVGNSFSMSVMTQMPEENKILVVYTGLNQPNSITLYGAVLDLEQ